MDLVLGIVDLSRANNARHVQLSTRKHFAVELARHGRIKLPLDNGLNGDDFVGRLIPRAVDGRKGALSHFFADLVLVFQPPRRRRAQHGGPGLGVVRGGRGEGDEEGEPRGEADCEGAPAERADLAADEVGVPRDGGLWAVVHAEHAAVDAHVVARLPAELLLFKEDKALDVGEDARG